MTPVAKVVLWRQGSCEIAMIYERTPPRLHVRLTDSGVVVRDEAVPDGDAALQQATIWASEVNGDVDAEVRVRCPVLVVEDDADLRAMMAQMLTMEGFAPMLATNGQDALDVLRTGPLPHVILLDLMMPVMDGWQFSEQQRRDPALARIPVIVMTAAPEQRLSGVNATAVFQKPVDFAGLLSAVRAHC
jgi:CheY-like chemotaxis protein